MKKSVFALFAVALLFAFSSCEGTEDILNNTGLSDEEIAEGLKEALRVGTDTSTAQLSKQNGYFNDLAVKIILPDELQNSITTFKNKSISIGGISLTGENLYEGYSNSLLGINIPGLKAKEDELIKGINRAAESAASTAGPIFFTAIADISISDAQNILFGGNEHAATEYLENKTSGLLFNQYEPKIDAALNQVQVGNTSVVGAYESFVTDYNAVLQTTVLGNSIGSMMNIQPVQAEDLSVYSTEKALDGLFLKVAEEEEDIRKNPVARINVILQKVFSELD